MDRCVTALGMPSWASTQLPVLKPFSRVRLHRDPIVQFRKWFVEAVSAGCEQPEAMALATASLDCLPSVRMVLLKGVGPVGFTFFTNYESRKGRDLMSNPHAALSIYWHNLGRQVRVSGTVTRLSAGESDDYFRSRPLESRIAAVVSNQSSVIVSRRVLDSAFRRTLRQSQDGLVPRPDYWGGYLLRPTSIEFWQQRPHRLHDRVEYTYGRKGWIPRRLAP